MEFIQMYPLPQTPSDTKEYQDKNPIAPEDKFYVGFDGLSFKESLGTIRDTFNKHGQGKLCFSLDTMIVVKDMSWDLVNEFRKHPNIRICGPAAK